MQKDARKGSGRVMLFLGGARSGKTALAEKIAMKYESVAYIATAEPVDDEMRERIMKHRESRPKEWQTYEVKGRLKVSVQEAVPHVEAIIVDCLTVYLARRMEHNGNDDELIAEVVGAVEAARDKNKTLIIVSNEVGMGIVPEHSVSRRYRDLLGKANQKVAAIADNVYLMVAGIPVDIKALANSEMIGFD